jgi:N6-L-threonylcarbamoyladenine synthase
MDDAVVLGIETSCDETAAALVRGGREVLASRVHSQVDLHAAWGGVVPELASRDHLARLLPVVDATLADANLRLEDVDCIAVTKGPGLVGALLVGVQTAKGLAAATGRPLVGVNHLEGHLAAVALEPDPPELPYLGLIVSGGHTSLYEVEGERPPRYRVLGRTRDDAAGEAFDKIARLLGLPYPGGKALDERARSGDPAAHRFPRGMRGKGLDFSFSGLKTAVANQARQLEREGRLPAERANLAAAFQAAVIDVLAAKTLRAVAATGCRRVLVGGGVAASRALRAALVAGLGSDDSLFLPSPRLATDNAAMIARTALFRFHAGQCAALDLAPQADLPFPGLEQR